MSWVILFAGWCFALWLIGAIVEFNDREDR
jgi:hypothetical protein